MVCVGNGIDIDHFISYLRLFQHYPCTIARKNGMTNEELLSESGKSNRVQKHHFSTTDQLEYSIPLNL